MVVGNVLNESFTAPAHLQALLAAAVDQLSDAILITEGETTKGPDGVRRIVFVNEAYVRMTGFSREEAIGQTPGITIGPASDRAQLRELEHARNTLRPIRVELLKYRRDGTTFWTELDVVPLFDDAGNNSHFLGVLRDVSERKRLQARLAETDRMSTIGTLAAGIGHEINNPLSYVMMNLSNALDELGEAGPPGLVAQLREALEGADRVRDIVRDIKTFSRDEPGAPSALDVAAVLDGALPLARKALSPRAEIVRAFAPSPPVQGDPARLGQVVLNLLLNAAHAVGTPRSDGAPHRVTIALHPDGPPDRPDAFACIEVRDTGVGIPADLLPRVFDPFFTTKPPGEGTGLGLSICHGIVAAMGGTLALTSAPGVGTTATVRLPATAARRSSDGPAPTVPGRRTHVLIVDDEPAVAHALARALRRDHDVRVALSGEEALAILAEGVAFDTLLCDLMMPGLTGMDLYEDLVRRAPALARAMIFMTGGAYTREARAFVDAIPAPLLDKPLDLAALRALLHRPRGPA